MRIASTASCRLRVLRDSCARPLLSRVCCPVSSVNAACATIASAITSSPTRLINWSTLTTLTRIEVASTREESWMSASDACAVVIETSANKSIAGEGAKKPKSPSGSSAMVATVGVASSPRTVMLIASAEAKNSRLSRSSSASISASRPKENATVCASNSRTSCAETRPSPAISSVSASMASSLNCARSSRSTIWNRGALDEPCAAPAVTLPTSTSICRRRDMPSRSGWRSCDSASMWSPMASPAFRNISTIGLVSASLPFLTRSRIDSKSWVNSAKSR